MPVELHDANGGWSATPAGLVRFARGVFAAEGKADVPVLFKPETLRQMTRSSTANPRYACGWNVSPGGDCPHAVADNRESFQPYRPLIEQDLD